MDRGAKKVENLCRRRIGTSVCFVKIFLIEKGTVNRTINFLSSVTSRSEAMFVLREVCLMGLPDPRKPVFVKRD